MKMLDKLRYALQPELVPALSFLPPCAASPSDPFAVGRLFAQGTGSDNDKKPTVRAQRRRRTTRPDGQARERADAPRRKRAAEKSTTAPPRQQTRPTTQGQRPASTPSLPSLPSGLRLPSSGLGLILLVVGVLIVACICIGAFLLMGGPDDTSGVVPDAPAPTSSQLPDTSVVDTAEPFVPPSTLAEGQTWLVMLYQDADDKILEKDIYVDLNEAERIGSSDRVHVVAQVDRYSAGYQGDGNWTSARRFYVTQDSDLQTVHSQLAADLGEVNMSDGATLVDFVTWAIDTFPADKHALILSDHGMGWPGGWSDPAPGGSGDPSIPLASRLGDKLYLMELDEALAEIRSQTGLDQFELIGLDACLMGHVEVFGALAPHARYAVASQETEPALGWAYTQLLAELTANPDMSGAGLAQSIVASYIEDDQRITDDEARADLLRQGSSPLAGLLGIFGGTSAEQLAQQMGQGITLTAVDLSAMQELIDGLNDLSYTLQSQNQQAVARARSFAQSYTSVFGKEVPPSYIDLGNFVQLLKQESSDGDLARAADRVLASLDRAVIAEKHGPKKPGSTGMSIYFPNSQLYQSPLTGPESYTAIARRFASESLWDDYLTFHYTGTTFEAAPSTITVPEQTISVRAPGAGDIQVSPITLSESVAGPGKPVLLSTDVRGQNIGYIYLFTGFYDGTSNSIFVADTDYLESADTREVDGVYYPVWPEGTEFTLEFLWEPLMFSISDGTDSVLAMLAPQSYGASYEQALYTVDGTYIYAQDGESRYARLTFSDGILRQVFGFTGENGVGAPREIIPEPGDSFTVLQKWMDLDQQGKVAKVATQEGGTLVFGDQMFTWEEMDAAPGEYIVGFIIEDLDGNAYEVYEKVMVE